MAHWEKQLQSRKIFSGKIFDVVVDDVEIENGAHAKREVKTKSVFTHSAVVQ